MGLSLLRKGRVGDVSLQRGIWQLAGVACGTLVVLCLLLSWSMDRYRQANDWVAHTLAILSQLNAYTRQITSLETAQRGYLLTQQADYLLPYWQVLNNRNNHFEQLNKLITDQDELRKLKRLAEILAAKKAELAQTIQLTQNGRLPEALAVVREGRGRRYTVEFQTLSREIGDRESAMLATRRAAVESQTDEMQIGVAIGCLLAMFLIIAAAIKTVGRFETRAQYLIGQLEATSEMRLEYPLEQTTRSGNKVLEAFDKMAARLLAARQAREATEADLAASNAELMRSNEELDGFAYGASHDLKAPLRHPQPDGMDRRRRQGLSGRRNRRQSRVAAKPGGTARYAAGQPAAIFPGRTVGRSGGRNRCFFAGPRRCNLHRPPPGLHHRLSRRNSAHPRRPGAPGTGSAQPDWQWAETS
jgi:CHASE3 domain sensor protein